MNTPANYPLKQVLEIKQRRVEAAEKEVKEKLAILESENEKLLKRQADRDKVKDHKKDKLTQLREVMDEGTTSPKIQQMKQYLKVVDEKLAVEEKKVREQQEQVTKAEKNLEDAKENLRIKRQEVDKFLYHKKGWELDMRKELQIIENREQDELGSIIHTVNRRKLKS